MIELVDTNDSRAFRNKANILGFYDLEINQKKAEEYVAKFASLAYIQHYPLIVDGPVALGQFFGQITRERAQARVVVHKIIALWVYVGAHMNFLSLFNDDPDDAGIAMSIHPITHEAIL
ncbi:hypothetical protein [Burkholderia sp. Bp9142]|uniref:hypothetical protein n=1 Tax=Burkholderia sp. Bp9142 TaxID=2184573 RepID=UPI000F59A32B|nr:hypothetical protein [Burkholderia sp. Bp9142]RQR27545.1 hypothetical protein DIE22_30250 [Burkholderia sp. Bp9142]